MQTTNQGNDDGQVDFIPSPTFQGAKPGFYFGTSGNGTGYYLDRLDQAREVVAGKKRKRAVRIAEEQNETKLIPNLLEQAEKDAAGSTVLELTPKGIQSATKALSKIAQQNAMQRAQFANEPRQYMNSELALYEQLTALQAVAANIHLYQHLIDNQALIETLTELLGHDNSDVSAATVGLFLEWIDPSLLSSTDVSMVTIFPVMKALASQVLHEAWEAIAANLSKSRQSEEEEDDPNNASADNDDKESSLDGVQNSLSLMENLLELDLMFPKGLLGKEEEENDDDDDDKDKEATSSLSAAAYMVKNSNILSWLFHHLDTKESSIELKARCVEILSLLSQKEDIFTILPDWTQIPLLTEAEGESQSSSKSAASTKKTINGIEVLLQTIGKHRKKQPESDQEVEILENTCALLSSCISFSTLNLEGFLEGQGIELVLRCLKERVHAGGSSLKLLDFFGTLPIHKKACESLIKAGGLKYLFPLLLGTRIPNPTDAKVGTTTLSVKAKKEWYQSIQTQVIRILYSISRYIDDDSPEDAKVRFVSKFAADERKCDRLVELLLHYDQKMRTAEYNFYLHSPDDEEEEEDQEFVQLAAMDAKLQGGGELFHRLGATAAFVCLHSKKCHARILEQLQLQRSGMGLILSALNEFASVLGEGTQKDQIQSLKAKLVH